MNPPTPNTCIRTPVGTGDYTLIRCGVCTRNTRHHYLGFENLDFSCPCGHSHSCEDTTPKCIACVAICVTPMLLCWNCEQRDTIVPAGYHHGDDPEWGPQPMYAGRNCSNCEEPFESSAIAQWEVMWLRPVGPWEIPWRDLSFEDWEKRVEEEGYDSDEDGRVEWKIFEVGVVSDDEPVRVDLKEFRREAMHRFVFPEPWDEDAWGRNRYDTGFLGWGYWQENAYEEWEKSRVKGGYSVMYDCLDIEVKEYITLGI